VRFVAIGGTTGALGSLDADDDALVASDFDPAALRCGGVRWGGVRCAVVRRTGTRFTGLSSHRFGGGLAAPARPAAAAPHRRCASDASATWARVLRRLALRPQARR
jgi:hypothetical protein